MILFFGVALVDPVDGVIGGTLEECECGVEGVTEGRCELAVDCTRLIDGDSIWVTGFRLRGVTAVVDDNVLDGTGGKASGSGLS